MSAEPMPSVYCHHDFYPGYGPDDMEAPVACRALDVFTSADAALFWPLDFHYPRGFPPFGVQLLAEGPVWGSQLAADAVPLPPTRGLQGRIVGAHVYAGEIPITDPWEIEVRARRAGKYIPAFLDEFPTLWLDRVAELERWLHHLEGFDPFGKSLPEIALFYDKSMRLIKRAWEIHFECMYPLVANYVGFYGLCTELGLDPGQIGQLLQGYDTKIMETDRELWKLTKRARELDLEDLFSIAPAQSIKTELQAAGADAAQFLQELDQFLEVYGRRSEGLLDVVSPPWIEDPTSPLGTIKTFLLMDHDHDFEQANHDVVAEREDAIASARARLTVEELEQFNAGLSSCQKANFNWWNEEHNFYIDLRAHLPARRAVSALAQAVGADRPEDGFYLFGSEITRVASGDLAWTDVRKRVGERRDYFTEWGGKRAEMPKMLGTVPENVTDPVMREVFGMGAHFFAAITGETTAVLKGVPAAAGTAEGRARVLFSPDDLHTVLPGEILVCEATSPNWTPAFAKIAACVCDSGGTLTHASIVSREYRIPCVTGVAVATKRIRTGDRLLVNGSTGEVTLLDEIGAGAD